MRPVVWSSRRQYRFLVKSENLSTSRTKDNKFAGECPRLVDDSSSRTYSESSTSSNCSLNDYCNKYQKKRVGIINVTNVTAVFVNNHKKLNRSQSEPRGRYNKHGNNITRYKTELCHPYEENGFCKYADKCQFAHGEAELRGLARHPKYKTELCRTFHAEGYCPYGARCHFIHQNALKNTSKPMTAVSFPLSSSVKDLSISSPNSLSSLSPASSHNAFSFGTASIYSPPPSPIEGRLPVFQEIGAPTFQFGGPFGGLTA